MKWVWLISYICRRRPLLAAADVAVLDRHQDAASSCPWSDSAVLTSSEVLKLYYTSCFSKITKSRKLWGEYCAWAAVSPAMNEAVPIGWSPTHMRPCLLDRQTESPAAFTLHPCLRSPEDELHFLRCCSRLLLLFLLPARDVRSFSLRLVLVEVLATKGELTAEASTLSPPPTPTPPQPWCLLGSDSLL